MDSGVVDAPMEGRYTVVLAESTHELARKVNAALAEGWGVCGPATYVNAGAIKWSQTLTRPWGEYDRPEPAEYTTLEKVVLSASKGAHVDQVKSEMRYACTELGVPVECEFNGRTLAVFPKETP